VTPVWQASGAYSSFLTLPRSSSVNFPQVGFLLVLRRQRTKVNVAGSILITKLIRRDSVTSATLPCLASSNSARWLTSRRNRFLDRRSPTGPLLPRRTLNSFPPLSRSSPLIPSDNRRSGVQPLESNEKDVRTRSRSIVEHAHSIFYTTIQYCYLTCYVYRRRGVVVLRLAVL
jgi:hypothetical protein